MRANSACKELRGALFGSRIRMRGVSLTETLFILVITGVVIAASSHAYQRFVEGAAETRAIANLRAIITAQTAFHAQRGRFGSFQQLIDEGLLAPSFARNVAGTGASEAIADGRYDYSFRFERDASGFTLDADPKPAHAAKLRRFRYRIRNSLDGRAGVILSAAPSQESPPARAYQPLEN